MNTTAGRTVDHVVMPVETLASARALLGGLGFTVAPDAAHPFGTGNACVFFADGTYLEPLAVLNRNLAETKAANGNAFLRRDLAYRLRHPLPGLSGVALKSSDALADRDAFVRAGYDGGEVLEFGRRFEKPDGTSVDLGFRLGFALDRAAPDTFVFACQRLSEFAPDDRTALTSHPNGVTGLARLVYAAREPETCRAFLSTVFDAEPTVANSLGFTVPAGKTSIEVLAPDGMAARYGEAGPNADNLRLCGIVLRTEGFAGVRTLTERCRAEVLERPGRLIVRMPRPSDVFLVFEADAGPE